jgi:hypothetical protein
MSYNEENKRNKRSSIKKVAMEGKQKVAVVWTCHKNGSTRTVKITNSPCTDWQVLWEKIEHFKELHKQIERRILRNEANVMDNYRL